MRFAKVSKNQSSYFLAGFVLSFVRLAGNLVKSFLEECLAAFSVAFSSDPKLRAMEIEASGIVLKTGIAGSGRVA